MHAKHFIASKIFRVAEIIILQLQYFEVKYDKKNI